jgi:hypothetical protein
LSPSANRNPTTDRFCSVVYPSSTFAILTTGSSL